MKPLSITDGVSRLPGAHSGFPPGTGLAELVSPEAYLFPSCYSLQGPHEGPGCPPGPPYLRMLDSFQSSLGLWEALLGPLQGRFPQMPAHFSALASAPEVPATSQP